MLIHFIRNLQKIFVSFHFFTIKLGNPNYNYKGLSERIDVKSSKTTQ